LSYQDGVDVNWRVRAERPTDARVTLRVEGQRVPALITSATVAFTPKLNVPAANYVPEPRPAPTDYQVGVYYFPGWWNYGRWQVLDDFPERRPVLGYYREGEPEVADWHIKWALEHGISFFIYDWYWDRGARQLEHALHDGFFKARYRDQFKFCLLWANHNPAGSSSYEDCEAVTRYWLQNYFHRPEHLTVEGKPVVVIFSTERLTQDLGHEHVKPAFDRMRELCREDGLPGLYLVACTYSHDEVGLRRLQEEGYDAVSGYNYPGFGAGGKLYAPVETMLAGYLTLWQDTIRLNILKEIPVLSGGWDSRPWAGDRALVRYGLNPTKFEDHCRQAKQLLDAQEQEPKLRMLFVEAWNEWGEGSYIEPHREFGFGYLDALRRVFTTAPDQHDDVIPADVGLGPYDCEPPKPITGWEFDQDLEGWQSAMGMRDLRAEDGALQAMTVNNDPAFFGPGIRVRAASYPVVEIRMRTTADDSAQLFWSTNMAATSEATSMHFDVTGDGQWHVYRVPVGDNPKWRSLITSLRLDPANKPNVTIAVDYVRFTR
jgi:hypothetical protein